MKNFIFIIFICLFSFSILAQEYGVKLGYNVSAIGSSSDAELPFVAKSGINIGLFAAFSLNDVIEFRPAIHYSRKGAIQENVYFANGASVSMTGDLTTKLDYLEIPLDFAFYIGGGGFSLNAGPYIGFLLSAKQEHISLLGGIDLNSGSFSGIQIFDCGLNLGASYVISEIVMLEMKYAMGLSNLYGDDIYNPYNDIALNGCLTFSVGYVF